MLSLVAYQSSDEDSENETDELANKSTEQNKIQGDAKATDCGALQNKHVELDNRDPKNTSSFISSFSVPAKTKETVKITVPSLKEFEDDDKDEPSVKKIRKSTGCGLISMLPPPKYSKPAASQNPFMPYVLTKKHSPSNSSLGSVSVTGPVVASKNTLCVKPLVKTESHSEKGLAVVGKDDHSPVMDFFSLQESVHRKSEINFSLPLSNTVLKSQEETPRMTENILQTNTTSQTSLIFPKGSQSQLESVGLQYSEFKSSSDRNYTVEPVWENLATSSSYPAHPESESTARECTASEGFLRLQGKRKGHEEINIIDVAVDDQLSDKSEWLTKSLTEEKVHRPSRKKHDMPTQLQKRKHQITYLAFQAKERELELKNQWSQNKLTKRETQAKYGF